MLNVVRKFVLVAFLAGVSAVVLTACAPNIRVSTDYDTAASLSSLKKYAWLKRDSSKPAEDPRVDNSLMYQRIERAVEAQLARQGFTKVDSPASADFLVAFHVFSEDKLDVRSSPRFYGGLWGGYYPCWYCGGLGVEYETEVTQYKEGEFIIDFVTPDSHKLVWRGSGLRRLTGQATPQEREVFVTEVIDAILQTFPPPS